MYLSKPQWSKLTSTLTDDNQILLPQYQHRNFKLEGPQPTYLCKTIPVTFNKEVITCWTDGSLTNKAKSSVWYGLNNISNVVFETAGEKSVFNAEAQAIECALYNMPLSKHCNIITDSKSLVQAVKSIIQTMQQKIHLLPHNSNQNQILSFTKSVMYQFSKDHKYATVLHSILFQILQRQVQYNTKVQFFHVYSHLIDHIMDNTKKPCMKAEIMEARMKKMSEIQGQNHALPYWELSCRYSM